MAGDRGVHLGRVQSLRFASMEHEKEVEIATIQRRIKEAITVLALLKRLSDARKLIAMVSGFYFYT